MKLRDLVAALADQWWTETAGASKRFSTKRYAKTRGDPSWLSRNTWVFDLTRWWAYDHAEKDGGAILEAALRFNGELAQPLPLAGVRATARSITGFMNTRYRPRHGADNRRGRDREAGAGLDPEARQALAGVRSAAARAVATNAKISAAVAQLHSKGQRITQAAVAAAAGVGVATVKRRWGTLRASHGMVSDAALSASTASWPSLKPTMLGGVANGEASALRGMQVLAADLAAEMRVAELRWPLRAWHSEHPPAVLGEHGKNARKHVGALLLVLGHLRPGLRIQDLNQLDSGPPEIQALEREGGHLHPSTRRRLCFTGTLRDWMLLTLLALSFPMEAHASSVALSSGAGGEQSSLVARSFGKPGGEHRQSR
jgi:hypothetical protein